MCNKWSWAPPTYRNVLKRDNWYNKSINIILKQLLEIYVSKHCDNDTLKSEKSTQVPSHHDPKFDPRLCDGPKRQILIQNRQMADPASNI